MPIKSYLVHPIEGKKKDLIEVLASINNCEIIPAENKDLVILVTETETEFEEEQLKAKLEAMPNIKLLALVSGFNTSQNQL
jgi:nitrate reductase NapAB chaperone NapD